MSKATLAGERGACYIRAMSAQALFNPPTREGFSPEQGLQHQPDLCGGAIAELEHETPESACLLELRNAIFESEARVRRAIVQAKNETLRWMSGGVVLIGATFTIVKFVR